MNDKIESLFQKNSSGSVFPVGMDQANIEMPLKGYIYNATNRELKIELIECDGGKPGIKIWIAEKEAIIIT